ncbi:MAG: small-conductance mechanosensitive channel [Methanolobus sp. T82-4]|nr:MAG: small-conductance mechanosensitive channel [Methanolobus sp. T82-4]
MAEPILDILNFDSIISLAVKTLAVIFLIVIFNSFLGIITQSLLRKAKTKKQISNVEIFSQIFKYIFILLVVVFAVLSYSGAWSGFGIFLGLLSAAIGFALQKPITGIAAWMMVVAKRPFDIGDRILLGDIKGDVTDITLTHIHIAEIGGIIDGEESSGRIVLVPNSLMFEKNIINYTYNHDFVFDSVITTVTYESNLDHAIEIVKESARTKLGKFIARSPSEPRIRLDFMPSGIDVQVKYFSPSRELHEYSSRITKEIFDRINEAPDVEIAYPHTEVVFRRKA